MTALQGLEELQKDACRVYQVDGFCNECPFNKANECLIYREIRRQKDKEATHGTAS